MGLGYVVVPHFICFSELLGTSYQLMYGRYVLVDQGIVDMLVDYPRTERMYDEVLVGIFYISAG